MSFEYHILVITEGTSIEDEDIALQKFGSAGWELINVVAAGASKMLYLKKELD